MLPLRAFLTQPLCSKSLIQPPSMCNRRCGPELSECTVWWGHNWYTTWKDTEGKMEEKGKMTRYLANNSLVRALEKIKSGCPSGAPSWEDYCSRTNKVPHTGWWKQQKLIFSQFWKAGSPRLRYLQDWVLLKHLSLLCMQLSSPSVLIWSSLWPV